MADFLYVTGAKEAAETYFLTTPLKAMLVSAGYVPNADDDVVDAGGANDAADHEVGSASYVGGWGGSGRKMLASKTVTVDKANNRVLFDCADVTWTALEVPVQPAHLLVVNEGIADDTTTRLHSHHDFVVTTNGGDITAQINDLWRLNL